MIRRLVSKVHRYLRAEAEAKKECARLLAEIRQMHETTRAHQAETNRLREETWQILDKVMNDLEMGSAFRLNRKSYPK